jgi:hypothetical protein
MRRIGLAAVRYGLPLAMVLVGIVMLELGDQEAGFGVVLIGCAGIVLLINTLFRLSIRSNEERAEEERARDEFERSGRWPGE